MKLNITIENNMPQSGEIDDLNKYCRKLENIKRALIKTLEKYGLREMGGGPNYIIASDEGPVVFGK